MTKRIDPHLTMRIGPRTFVWGARTYIMGVINVSPDSFSGDGLLTVEAAVEQARRFVDEGADILDVGGQSTRPGANKTEAGFDEMSPEEEIRRVVPAIERIRAALPDTPISIDTYKPEVAPRRARCRRAHDQRHLRLPRATPSIARIAAEARVPAVVMHNQRGRAPPHDVSAASAIEACGESMRIAAAAGIDASMLIVDPGFGFGWTPEHNIEMLRRLGELRALGLPLLARHLPQVHDRRRARRRAGRATHLRHRRQRRARDRRRRGYRPRTRRRGDEAGRARRGRDRPGPQPEVSRTMSRERIFLGLGANVGDREANMRHGACAGSRVVLGRRRFVAVPLGSGRARRRTGLAPTT